LETTPDGGSPCYIAVRTTGCGDVPTNGSTGTDRIRHAQIHGVSVSPRSQGRVSRRRDWGVDILISIVTTIYSASVVGCSSDSCWFKLYKTFFFCHLVFGFFLFLTRFIQTIIFYIHVVHIHTGIAMQNFTEHSSNTITKPTNSKSSNIIMFMSLWQY
jgi:hypothetical protein